MDAGIFGMQADVSFSGRNGGFAILDGRIHGLRQAFQAGAWRRQWPREPVSEGSLSM